jgi:hypothetical protein
MSSHPSENMPSSDETATDWRSSQKIIATLQQSIAHVKAQNADIVQANKQYTAEMAILYESLLTEQGLREMRMLSILS